MTRSNSGALPRRILVTGGRDWDDAEQVYRVLSELRTALDPVVVHGDQGRYVKGRLVGLDRIAARTAQELGMRTEPHPAYWDMCHPSCPPGHRKRRRGSIGGTYCPLAGPRRNRVMAELGADLCLAWPGGSGTAGMVRLARSAGIRVEDAAALVTPGGAPSSPPTPAA